MTPEQYWNSEGVRFLNEDGTLPTVEQRVKEAFKRGHEDCAVVPELLRVVGKRHELEVENEKLREEIKELQENAERIGVNRYEKLNKAEAEVARFRKELEKNKVETPRTDAVFFSFHTHDDLVELSEKLERDLVEKTNEVARLRELLNRAIEIAEEIRDLPAYIEFDGNAENRLYKKACKEIEGLKARVAPAPRTI